MRKVSLYLQLIWTTGARLVARSLREPINATMVIGEYGCKVQNKFTLLEDEGARLL